MSKWQRDENCCSQSVWSRQLCAEGPCEGHWSLFSGPLSTPTGWLWSALGVEKRRVDQENGAIRTPLQTRVPNSPLMHQAHQNFRKFAARKTETLSDVGVRPPTHLCSRGTLPTHCCWPAQGTRTWIPASQPGRTSCSVGSCAAEGSAGWPARRRHAEGWLSGAVHARSFKEKRKNMLKVLNNDFSNCL